MKKILSLILVLLMLFGWLPQIAVAMEGRNPKNLIDERNPISANPAVWAYTDGVWMMTNSNYANLRYDVALNEFDTVQFSFDAKISSGKVTATIRTLDNQFLATNTVNQNGTVVLKYTVVESGTYRFQICGVSDTSCAEISNISIVCTNSDELEAQEHEAERVAKYVEQLNPNLSVLLFADNHSYARTKYLKYSKIMSLGVIDYQIGLGDFVDYSHAPKEIASKQLEECIAKAGRQPNCYYAYGNHDVGICGVNAGSNSLDVVMTPEENYAIFGIHLEKSKNVVTDAENPHGGYYYVDDEDAKVRMIVLNTSDIFDDTAAKPTYIRYRSMLRVSQTQLTWFAEKALSFADKEKPSDWAVIVFGHDYNPYGGELLLFEILNAVHEGKAFDKTTTVYTRLTDNGDGTYSSETDKVNGDTYCVNVDYSKQGPVTVMGFIHGHNHVDTQSVIKGINCIQIRCDNGNLDQYYIAHCGPLTGGSYYFRDKNGHAYTFKCGAMSDVASVGYNNYWTSAKMSPAPIAAYDAKGLRIASISCKYAETIPENAIEITGFVEEHAESSVKNESCQVLCVDKNTQTLRFVPYGTGTERIIPYQQATVFDRCEANGHSFKNGICTGCGKYYVNFQSASISLAGNIAINFYVELGQPILDDEGAYMSFTLPDGTTKTAMLSDAEVSVKNGVTRYVFTCEVHAKQMADMVVAQMHLGDGTAVGDSRSYSVVTYAGYIIAHEDQYAAYPSLVNLLKTMLNYGAYSQIHFGYNVNNLANANLNLTLNDVTLQNVEAYRPKRAGSMTGLEITSVALILRSETVLRFYYTLASGCNIEDYNFVVNGQAVRPIYNQDNGRYYVDVTNIAAKDLDREYGVTVTNKAGTESLSVIASAMSYVYQVIASPAHFAQDVKDVVKAMYAYNIAANAYFK